MYVTVLGLNLGGLVFEMDVGGGLVGFGRLGATERLRLRNVYFEREHGTGS